MSGPNGEGLYVRYGQPVSETNGPAVPEDAYLDAARIYAHAVTTQRRHVAEVERRSAEDPAFRAAVESAYRAGYGQGRDDEAAGVPTS
jgi:hypothetical protein